MPTLEGSLMFIAVLINILIIWDIKILVNLYEICVALFEIGSIVVEFSKKVKEENMYLLYLLSPIEFSHKTLFFSLLTLLKVSSIFDW